eukprot:1177069-Prymnesium_polylepis.1
MVANAIRAVTLALLIPTADALRLAGVRHAPAAAARLSRAGAPRANLFDDLGKIAEYNKKFFSTAIAGMTDSRTARASHILFGFEKYGAEAAEKAALCKDALIAGEISFEDAAKEFSSCPSAARGGDLGTFKRGAMVP